MPSTTISEQVNVLNAGSASQATRDAMGAFAREQAELAVRGMPDAVIKVGSMVSDASLLMQDKNELTFTVLSDPGNDLANTVGVVTAPSSEARAAQLHLGLDLEVVNADGTTAIPMPTALIVDADCVVQWVDVHPDYTTRSEPTELLDILDALGTATQ